MISGGSSAKISREEARVHTQALFFTFPRPGEDIFAYQLGRDLRGIDKRAASALVEWGSGDGIHGIQISEIFEKSLYSRFIYFVRRSVLISLI